MVSCLISIILSIASSQIYKNRSNNLYIVYSRIRNYVKSKTREDSPSENSHRLEEKTQVFKLDNLNIHQARSVKQTFYDTGDLVPVEVPQYKIEFENSETDSLRMNEFLVPEKRSIVSHQKNFSIESLDNQGQKLTFPKSDYDSARPSLLSTMKAKFQQFLAISEIIYEAASPINKFQSPRNEQANSSSKGEIYESFSTRLRNDQKMSDLGENSYSSNFKGRKSFDKLATTVTNPKSIYSKNLTLGNINQ